MTDTETAPHARPNARPNARHVALLPQDHAGVRVNTAHAAHLGDGVMFAPVFPQEFRQVQAHYPIVFMTDKASGGYRPVALFGLEAGNNLFLKGDGTRQTWDADYIPLAHRMQPFLIGRSREGDLSVHINLDHPRVNETGGEGELLFLPDGGEAPALHDAADVLARVHEGEQTVVPFCAMLTELELIEPFTLDITLDDGTSGRLAGYYTIAEEKLAALSGAQLQRLNQAGALSPVFMAVASIGRFSDLIARRNAQAAGAASGPVGGPVGGVA